MSATEIDQHAVVAAKLQPGEQLLWVGQSDPHKLFGFHDRYLVPFSIFFAAAVTSGLVAAVRGAAHPAVLVLLSVLVVIALHVFVGRFFMKLHRKRTEVYAVTDHRALVVTERTTRETDIRRADRFIDDSGDHLSVQWNDTGDLDTLFWGGSDAVRQYANTGLDGISGMRRDFAFYDVRDRQGLIEALEQAAER